MIRLIKIILFAFCLVVSSGAKCQKKEQTHLSPQKTAILSAAMPGLGQVYNKKYWKVPIIYAGLLTSAYYVKDNHQQYKMYKSAYLTRVDNDPNTTDEFVGKYSNSNLIELKDFYRRNREISALFLVGTYILNIVDASVDAHLFYYDISEDISLNIIPFSELEANGFSLQLNF